MKFKLSKGLHGIPTILAPIASATVIEAGDMVTIADGLIVKAAAASTAIAYAPKGSADGETVIEITVGNDFTVRGTLSTNFVLATHAGGEYDLTDTTQVVNAAASTTKVLKVGIATDSATVGAATGVEFRIIKPLF